MESDNCFINAILVNWLSVVSSLEYLGRAAITGRAQMVRLALRLIIIFILNAHVHCFPNSPIGVEPV